MVRGELRNPLGGHRVHEGEPGGRVTRCDSGADPLPAAIVVLYLCRCRALDMGAAT